MDAGGMEQFIKTQRNVKRNSEELTRLVNQIAPIRNSGFVPSTASARYLVTP